MPLYQFYCEKCDNSFDEMVHLNGKKPPSRRKCPDCKKMAKRFYAVEISAQVFGVTDKSVRRHREYEEKGMNKEQAEQFYKYSIEHSKERMNEGWKHYKQMNPNIDYMVKKGIAKVDSDGVAAKKLETARRNQAEITELAEKSKWIKPRNKKKK